MKHLNSEVLFCCIDFFVHAMVAYVKNEEEVDEMNEQTKESLLSHYAMTMTYVKDLEQISEEAWRTSYAEGKWTVAEIIGHLSPWDRFMVAERIPYLLAGEPFRVAPDSQAVNDEAAKMSREQQRILTIDEFLVSRDLLRRAVELIPEERLQDKVVIKDKELTIGQFLGAMTQHDLHHMEQINQVIG
ncbi:MAG TPA: hypothetical protein DDW40_06275 [Exiguobacterium sp.]|nr:hypothetical protein [Exiguobacterium sp.]